MADPLAVFVYGYYFFGVRKMTFWNVSAYGILLAVISIFDHRVISALLVRVIGK